MKICKKCNRELDEVYFGNQPGGKNGLTSQCKDCKKEYNRTYHEKNKDSIHVRHQQYRKDNKGSINNAHAEWFKTELGKECKRRNRQRRRGFGYEPINNKFEDSVFHHLHIDEDHNIGIYLPNDLHQSMYHNSFTGEGMLAINIIALLYLSKH